MRIINENEMISESEMMYDEVRKENVNVVRRCEALLEEAKVAMKVNETIMDAIDAEPDDVCRPHVIVLNDNMVSEEPYDFSGCTYLEETPMFCSKKAARLAIDILLRNFNWTQNRFEYPVNQNGYKKNN